MPHEFEFAIDTVRSVQIAGHKARIGEQIDFLMPTTPDLDAIERRTGLAKDTHNGASVNQRPLMSAILVVVDPNGMNLELTKSTPARPGN